MRGSHASPRIHAHNTSYLSMFRKLAIPIPGAKMSTNGPELLHKGLIFSHETTPTIDVVGSDAGDFVEASNIVAPTTIHTMHPCI